MADKIKKEDLFDSQLFSEVLPGLEKYVQLLDKAEKEAVEFLKVQRDIANVRTFNDSASIDAQAKSEKVYTDVIKQGILLRKEKLDAEKKLVEIEIQKQKLADMTDKAAKKAIDNTQNYTKRVRELTKELATIDPKKEAARYTAIAKEAGALKDKIGDARAAVKAFSSDSKATTAKTLFGQIITDLKDLNFADAADKARQLSAVIKSISFTEIAAGAKNFTFAILEAGKALLLNPFTLFATAIAGISYVLYNAISDLNAFDKTSKTVEENLKSSTDRINILLKKQFDFHIKLKQLQGQLTKSEADRIIKENDQSQDRLTSAKEYAQKVADLAKELDLSLSDLQGNRFKENYTGDNRDRLNRVKFNREIKKLEDQRTKEVKEAARTQALEISVIRKEAESKEIKETKKTVEKVGRAKVEAAKVLKGKLDEEKTTLLTAGLDQEMTPKQRQEIIDFENERLRIKREKEKEAAAKRQKEIEDITIDQIEKSLERQNKLKMAALDQELQQRERNIQQQQSLAERGLDNQLAFEQAQLAKAELAKAELAKKEQRQKEALALMKLIADDGFVKGSIEFALAKAIAGSFKDGVEDLDGPGTETSDSILARLSKGESVATASATRENPGLVTAMNKGKVDEYFKNELLPGYMTETGINTGSFAKNVANSAMIHKLSAVENKLEGVIEAIKSRPVHQSEITNAGDVIETKIANGLRTVILHKTAKKPL